MQLHYTERGQGPPLLLLHGLFGSGDNLASVARDLASDFRVISLDLRNHGHSPHDNKMNYPSMAQDVVDTMSDLEPESAHVMGHSMGGKIAMQMALTAPERISRLCISDIAPVQYSHHHSAIISGLRAVCAESIHSRSDADDILAQYIEEAPTRGFLLKSLARTADGKFEWRMNLEAIVDCYAAIAAPPDGTPFEGPTLFIGGGNSDYIRAEHQPDIKRLFPNARYRQIQGAGHWLHAEKPAAFNRLVRNFLTA